MNKNSRVLILYLGLFWVLSFALVLWISPYGPGISPDSTTYIGAAKSLIEGKGFAVDGSPITHYPPLYPFILAVSSLLGNNIIQAARILNALIYGFNVVLIALAVFIAAGRNYLTTTCSVFLFLASAPLLELHSMAWSEPLFITLTLACILSLSMYIARPTRSLFVASSLCLGLALITRYIGIAFIPAAFVILFFGRLRQTAGKRIRETIIWLLLASAPLFILFIGNMIIAGSATNRSFVFHPVLLSNYVVQILSTTFDFCFPTSLSAWVKQVIIGLFAFILVFLIIILLKRHLKDIKWRSVNIVLPLSCLCFSISYIFFLFISISFLDAATPVDNRLLSPIFLALLVGCFSGIWILARILKMPIVWWGFLIITALSISIKTPEAIRLATNIQGYGLGYTSRLWRDSESVAFVKALPESVKIYSNGQDVVSLISDNESRSLPAKMSSGTLLANSNYIDRINAMCKDIKENKAILIYFNYIHWRWYYPTQEEVYSFCKLPILLRLKDGTAYGEAFN